MIKPKLVSVIIPSYNHARYLPQAIDSVLSQDYSNIEVIVVDDGSTDNTKDVMAAYPMVRYVYKSNGGLSSARNAGIDKSVGELLAFLDADDWYFPGALSNLVECSLRNPHVAFVYGSYRTVNANNDVIAETKYQQDFGEQIFVPLLENNFITLPATVLYQRKVFDEFRFESAFPSCADYDMYLNIARHNPVKFCPQIVAAYRRHGENMSDNYVLMEREVLAVMQAQKKKLRNAAEKKQWYRGVKAWKNRYGQLLLQQLQRNKFFSQDPKIRAVRTALIQSHKPLFIAYLFKKLISTVKNRG